MPRKSNKPAQTERRYRRLLDKLDRGHDLHKVASQAGIKPATLKWWRSELRRRDALKQPELLPVVLTSPATLESPLELVLPRARILIRSGFDARALQRLLEVLEQKPC